MSPDVEDLIFVRDQLQHIAALPRAEKVKIAKENPFCTLPHPSGTGAIPCPKNVRSRLYSIVHRAVEKDHRDSLDTDRVFSIFVSTFADRFLRHDRPINEREAARAISSAIREGRRGVATITHFLPCRITKSQNPSRFTFAGVEFVRQEKFVEQHKADINAVPGFDASATAEALEHFSKFGWVAVVRTEDRDAKSSQRVARRQVQTALDCLTLLVNRRRRSWIKLGGDAQHRRESYQFASVNDGPMHVTWAVEWNEEHFGQDDWWSRICGMAEGQLLPLLSASISKYYLEKGSPSLATRIVDALTWFGEGARDEFDASSIVKFATAVERLVTTGRDEIARTFSERPAALIAQHMGEFDVQAKRFSEIYKLRSNLVHGSWQPSDPRIASGRQRSCVAAGDCIIAAALAFGEAGLNKDRVSDRELGQIYDGIVAQQSK